ncbi:MAG: hypothetical protein AB1665_05975 [Candidatus Thermoplasmatota archaeon]
MTQHQRGAKRRKRKSDEIKMQILRLLEDGRVYTYSGISRSLDTGYPTVKANCEFLRVLGLIELSLTKKEESASGRGQSAVRITKKGRTWLSEIGR